MYDEKRKEQMLAYQRTLKRLSIKTKPEYYAAVSEYADKIGIPIRQVVILALDEYIAKHPLELPDE